MVTNTSKKLNASALRVPYTLKMEAAVSTDLTGRLLCSHVSLPGTILAFS
jgi:hypothetical protein